MAEGEQLYSLSSNGDSNINNGEYNPQPSPGSACIMIDNVPTHHKSDDIRNNLCRHGGVPHPLISDVKVLPKVFGGGTLTNTVDKYALASVPTNAIQGIPPLIELQTELPQSPVSLLFQEQVLAEFILTQELTDRLKYQLGTEGQKLAIQLSFPRNNTIAVIGNCSQVYKFREYLTAILAHITMTSPHSEGAGVHCINVPATTSLTIPIEEPPLLSTTAIVPSNPAEESKSFSGLSHDVLLLMSRANDFKGMVFHPEEGKVEVLPSTEEEQEQCITKFQQYYQEITKNRQLKSGDISVPVSFPPENLVALFEEFNEKYNQCHFSYDEKKQTIRIISMSSRQFDQAKKLISDRLEEGGVKPKEVKPTATGATAGSGKIATKVGSSETLQLSKNRKIIVKRGNIVDEEVDVIVNAANGYLQHAGGVAYALDKASYGELQRVSSAYVKKYGSVPVGGAATTKAGGKLKCKHVIHAVGPTQQMSETHCSELIFNAITNSLIEAEKIKATSISFPALSTGIFAVNKSLAADAIFQALMKYHYSPNKILKDIRVIILDEPTYKCFAQHVIGIQSTGPSTNQVTTNKNGSNKPSKSTTPTATYSTQATTSTAAVTTTSTVWSTAVSTGTSSRNIWSTGGSNVGWSTQDPPGLDAVPGIINQQPTSTNNIHYPLLSSSFANPSPVAALSIGRGRGIFEEPKFHYTSPGAGRGRGYQTMTGDGRGHPPMTGDGRGHPPMTEDGRGHPPMTGGHQPTTGGHQPMTGGHQPMTRGHQPMTGGHPPMMDGSTHKLQHQLSDPTGMSSGSQEDDNNKFKTPPVTPPKTPPPKDDKGTTDGATGTATDLTEAEKPSCPICLNSIATEPVTTNCCNQVYCKSCIDTALEHSCYCPTCKKALRPVKGNQPPGTMEYRISSSDVPGYEGCGSIVITYTIHGGTQGPEHPNPGTGYHGTSRIAYLPNNPEGQHVLGLLKKAFDAGLIFTIGTSHTSGKPNTVVWNDIHHKTSRSGTQYGYPDPTYLERVKEELKAKGIE